MSGTPRRYSRGAKLDEEKVRDIRERIGRNRQGSNRSYRGWSYRELAKKHGVSVALVAQVAQGRAWPDVIVEREDDDEDF